MKKACLTTALLTTTSLVGSAHAATFNLSLDAGSDFTIVEIDPFPSGGTAGNTVNFASPGSFWSVGNSSAADDDLWYSRAYNAFNTGYLTAAPSATNRVFELGVDERGTAPELRTTISVSTASEYEVILLYTYRNDSSSDTATTRAVLNGTVGDTTPIFDASNATGTIGTPTSTWTTAYTGLGTTGPSATGFTVNLAGAVVGTNGRNHVLAVGYRAVPEPGSLALLGLGGLCLLKRRRRD